MTTVEARGEPFDIGRVVTRTFGSIGRNAATFFILALGLVGVPQAILGYLQVQLNPATAGLAATTSSPGEMITYGLLVIVIALATIVLSALLQAAIIRGVVEDLNGRRVRAAECLSAGMSVALPVIAISIMVGLGIFGGLILLIVPGIILAVRWIVAVPVRVMEQPGVFAAIGRSADLTKGSRWAIFAVALVFAILAWVLSAVVLGLGAAFSIATSTASATSANFPVLVLTAILNVVTSTISSAGIASIYCELRAITEGASPSSLAAVFD